MESRIMQIFYGNDCLPYKDKERTVHYPIIGQAFNGSSNTNEIRFYVDRIGTETTKWLAQTKLPSGKKGYKLLTTTHDYELDEDYCSLSLTQFYTQEKGDIYISLNGYEGGEILEQDDDDNYVLVGTPTIQATGSIKITLQYAVQILPSDIAEYVSLDDILAYISGKADVDYTKLNYVPRLELKSNETDYTTKALATLLNEKFGWTPAFTGRGFAFVLNLTNVSQQRTYTYFISLMTDSSTPNPKALLSVIVPTNLDRPIFAQSSDYVDFTTNTTGSLSSLMTLSSKHIAFYEEKVQKYTGSSNVVYVSNAGSDSSVVYSKTATANNIVQRNGDANVIVPQNTTGNTSATSKYYVDTEVGKAGHSLEMSIDSDYDLVIKLKDKNGNVISTQDVDLPLESIIVSATYYTTYTYGGVTYTNVIVIILATTDVPTIVPVGDLVSGLVTESQMNTAIANAITTLKGATNTWGGYNDFTHAVQAPAVQSHQGSDLQVYADEELHLQGERGIDYNIGGGDTVSFPSPSASGDSLTLKSYVDSQNNLDEKLTNKVTAISSLSTNTEYPTAKAVYDSIQGVKEQIEGRSLSIIVSYNDTYSAIVTYLSNNPTKKVYLVDGTDITEDFLLDDLPYNNILNGSLNNTDNVIPSDGYLAVKDSNGDYILYNLDTHFGYVDLKNGDIVYVKETGVPDRWFDTYGELYALDGKTDLSGYYSKSADIIPTTNGTSDIGSSNHKFKDIWGTNLKGFATITQAQYNAIVSGGTVDSDTFYFIEE